jgi:four helix bundle protein
MRRAFAMCMKATNIDDVVVYREANDAADAVSALLERSAFSKDFDLKDQPSRSSSRIPPLIAERFGQLSDKHLAVYLGRARGSALETQNHLRKALNKKFILESECADLSGRYVVIGKRLTRWIGYLKRSNWKSRG